APSRATGLGGRLRAFMRNFDASQSHPDPLLLRRSLDETYRALASGRHAEVHFRHGIEVARELGYERSLLEASGEAASCFCGVGDPLIAEPLEGRQTVLDVGCGIG